MNFNLPLHLFEDQIVGVRKLVDVCASADHNIRLMITSSIGVANGWLLSNGPVPEVPLSDPVVAASTGYTASKYIVEQVRQLVLRAPGYSADAMGTDCRCSREAGLVRNSSSNGTSVRIAGKWRLGHDRVDTHDDQV